MRDDENGQHHQNSGFWLVFDAYQNLNLESVKVYANGAGNRTIALVNANGAESGKRDGDMCPTEKAWWIWASLCQQVQATDFAQRR